MNNLLQIELFSSLNQHGNIGWFKDSLECLKIDEETGWPDGFGNALCKWNAGNPRKEIRVLSLFSGGGGLDIGFHDAGFRIVECNEIEPVFAATLEKNTANGCRLEGTNVVCKDIHYYSPEVGKIDFIIGGPPCQTFSAAGARAAGVNGTDDDRGNLFLEYARIINQIQPMGFLFENVYRIIGAQSGKAWVKIQAAFEELGYKLYWRILDAADYGVPQFRERLIIIGLKSGEFLFPCPSHGPDSPDGHSYFSARQAVAGVEPSNCVKGLTGRHGHLLKDIPPGLNYSFYTERMGHPNPFFAWRSKFSDYLYKADPDTPVRTIKAQGGQYTGPFSWENRPFAIEEFKRLQTFPDDYIITGNRQAVIHQLGNSVPPQFARILALSILQQVFNVKTPFRILCMPHVFQLGFRTRKAALTEVYLQKAKEAIGRIDSNNLHQKKTELICGREYFNIGDDLRLQENIPSTDSLYCVDYRIDSDKWEIHLSESRAISNVESYKIQIESPISNKNAFNANVILTSSSIRKQTVLIIWKIFETLARRYLYKDDLIQLFGYYQYKNIYRIEMNLLNDQLLNNPFWCTVRHITMGYNVGSIMVLSDLCNDFNLSHEILMSVFEQMKEIGFEIRNHNTNKQIAKGMVLIPYAFPTLNERSLQRLTRL